MQQTNVVVGIFFSTDVSLDFSNTHSLWPFESSERWLIIMLESPNRIGFDRVKKRGRVMWSREQVLMSNDNSWLVAHIEEAGSLNLKYDSDVH